VTVTEYAMEISRKMTRKVVEVMKNYLLMTLTLNTTLRSI